MAGRQGLWSLPLLALLILAPQGSVWVPHGSQDCSSGGEPGSWPCIDYFTSPLSQQWLSVGRWLRGGMSLGPMLASGLPSSALIQHPLMVGWDDKKWVDWDTFRGQRKVANPGQGRHAANASVLLGHPGGLYDAVMAEHLKTVCDPKAGSKSCKRKVCSLARGDWCKAYYNQDPVPWRPPPRGDKECPATQYGPCNRVGSCQYDIGVCLCPAGWRGPDCGTRDPRPCTHRYRQQHVDGNSTVPISHAGPDGRDKDWSEPGWTASRCAGYCDEDIAMCYCPPGTKYGIEPAPPGSPPGTPPLKRGRPMGDSCKPDKNPSKGNAKVEWGNVDTDAIFGPDGWCNADLHPRAHCGCIMDGWQGHLCELPIETYCINQCSGHGECQTGFCKCHDGWYGMDCSRQRASAKERTKGDHEPGGSKPYLTPIVVDPPAAMDPPPHPTRRRPLIYIYDVDPLYNTKMIQYRIARTACAYRLFGNSNETFYNSYVYSLESYFIEMLTQSAHRTFDPEEADFFFVPVMLTCYLWPVLGWADHPWFGMPAAHSRAHQGSNMYLGAKRWIQQHYPFWDRRGGRDHIWMILNDEGACWMPTEIFNTSIVLSHWGRMDFNHVSGTAWGYDNYSAPLDPWPPYTNGDWRVIYDGHPCYTPGKDLIIPSLKPAAHFVSSPLLGALPMERDILLYMRGDTGSYRAHWYSRGIRQRLSKLAYMNDWGPKYRIYIGESWQIPGSYSEHLSRSTFCVVAPGDGWSARAEDAILHGCIPLVIMDGVHAVFESILEWDAFSVRIKEEAVNEGLPQFLMSISPEQIERMQRRLSTVWHRFAYAMGPLISGQLEGAYVHNQRERRKTRRPDLVEADAATSSAARRLDPEGRGLISAALQASVWQDDWLGPAGHPYQPYTRYPTRSDAWNTIMAWLHSRIPHTRQR